MKRRPKRLISRLDLVHRVECNRSYVYRQCATGGKLEAAMVGVMVDLSHPDAAEFCSAQGYREPPAPTASAKKARTRRKPSEPPPPPEPEPLPEPEDIASSEMLAMPLGEVIAKFGTAPRLKAYVAVVKSLVQTRGYEEDQARKRADYIHRVHVEQLVIHVEALQKNLLTDAVRNMATRAIVQVAAGQGQVRVEKDMRGVISRVIKTSQRELERRLRNV